jgi:tellurium resistance protein TerZ
MAIRLQKGQRINLKKETGDALKQFCVGCNWGAVTRPGFLGFGKKNVDVDLDLSCLMFDAAGKICDHIYSNLYRFADRNPQLGLPNGKLDSIDRAFHHTGDDMTGDQDGDDGLDNEIITVDIQRVNPSVNQIVFFLNIYNNDDFQGDFSEIPYASIRMYEGTPTKVRSVFAQYDVATKTECAGKRALIMGKLYKHNGEWKFSAIGDAFEDHNIVRTIARVTRDYSK